MNGEPSSTSSSLSPVWICRGQRVVDGPAPRVMGVINVTPDSFSDGGRALAPSDGASLARELVEAGAHLLDLGGESSRPGALPVGLDEELRRVIPALEQIAGTVTVPISVDTVRPELARRALDAGAAIINDITALGDPAMARLAAETGAGVVLMHMAGTPRTMQQNPHYADVVLEVHDFLARRTDWAEAQGIARWQIALDPGIGFGKTLEHNLRLLQNLPRFASLGCALLVGTSRKGFLGTLTGRPVTERALASVVSSLAAIEAGASVVRVHDVAAMVEALKVWTAVRAAR